MTANWHDIDEGLGGIALLEQRLQIARLTGESTIEGGMNAANHGGQMGYEGELYRPAGGISKPLTDFRQVAVAGGTIGFHRLASLGQQRRYLGPATGTGYTG